MSDEENPNIDNDETTSSKVRKDWLGTFLATVIVVSTWLVWGYIEVLTGTAVPNYLKTIIVVGGLMTVTWAFGKKTLEAVKEYRS